MLELVPITLKEANAFVERYHRHHKPVVGHKFSIAASDGEKIVGVAIVGRPVSRYLDNGLTLESSDRLRIIEGKAEVYVGYLAAFKPFADHEISEEYRKYSGHEVKKFRAVPEITHRRWKELGLMKPLEPDQTAQYKFSDLQMSLYYTIYI